MTKFSLRAAVAVGALMPSLAAAQSMSTMPGMAGMDHSKMHMPAPKPAATKPKTKQVSRPALRAAASTPAAKAGSPKPAAAQVSTPGNDTDAAQPTAAALSPAPSSDAADDAPVMDHGDHDQMGHAGHDMAGMSDIPGMGDMHSAHDMQGMSMGRGGSNYADGSGTSRLPASEGTMHGVHFGSGDWAFMLHGYLWGAYTDQGGPRGDHEVFATSMLMLNATHDLNSRTHLTLRTMLSLEPLMGPRGYPNLFATGETADGVNQLLDRQHPHDLFMELAARIDVDIGRGSAFVYAAPVGEPALGPSAFMHRGSAKYQTLSPITHHWFDSTHISYGVITAGYAAPKWQIEASAYRGREPDQHRWDIETPALDSWSVRATWTPSPDWAVQVSHGFLKSPEQLEPNDNERRTTASIQYARGGLATTFAFSNKDKGPGRTLTAWLAEANWDITKHHTIFGRAENVANDELFPDTADPLNGQRFRVTKLEGGYAYRLPFAGPFNLALGGSVAGYAYPSALAGAYGTAPVSYTLFAKLSLGH